MAEEKQQPKYSRVDFLLTFLGLVFLLLDIGLDVYAVVTFYQDEAYVSLGILLLFLVGSSVLVQVYSWLWYSDEDFSTVTKVEGCLSRRQLALLHVFQLGIYLRHAGVAEVSVLSFFTERHNPRGRALFLSHDLSMLRVVETFSESSPQLVLMLTLIMQRRQFDPATVLKALGSASSIALCVTMYHRSLRSFLPDKKAQQVTSSVVYFLWNLCLISSRLVALALFASVLPCFVFAHFFCSWLLLFFAAWRCETDFMESPGWEWLYRGTLGLIWYFAWFGVVRGRTWYRMLLSHAHKLADISLLCGLWCWKIRNEPSHSEMSTFGVAITAVGVVGVYVLGLLGKVIYYKCYHPNLSREELKGNPDEKSQTGNGEAESGSLCGDVVDHDGTQPGTFVLRSATQLQDVTDRGWTSPPEPGGKRYNKRMRKLAENFYS